MSHHRGLLILVGIVALGFWLLTISFQVQTTEAMIMGGSASVGQITFRFNWSVIAQPYYLFIGSYSGVQAIAVLVAWVVETAFLVLVFLYDAAAASIGKGSRRASELFMSGLGLIAIFNIVADFIYAGSLSQAILMRLFIAGVLSFAVAFFGSVSMSAFERA